jgi:hypothetical protein
VFKTFYGCYIYTTNFYRKEIFQGDVTFVSSNYFHLAVESCLLAILEPGLYPGGNCEELGVNLRVFSPFLPGTSAMANSLLVKRRLQGPGTQDLTFPLGVLGTSLPQKNRYPWQCSLRTPGYRGFHRCGVTLLSGPPKPTILVSAAHCNYLCKDSKGRVVEICCCRQPESIFSCSTSDFCGQNSTLQPALPTDLQIVCNIRSQETIPQGIGFPDATILEILEIRNHPNYKPLSQGSSVEGGPIEGYDISIYIVDDTVLKQRMNKSTIWPACLPQIDNSYVSGNRGILAGWNDPLPTYLYASTRSKTYSELLAYAKDHLVMREALFEALPSCADPVWMKSQTYYPPGTLCFTEAGWASSVQFGISGSGLVKPFYYTFQNGTKATRYSWAGPLSMSKGSDRTVISDYAGPVSYSSNPAVFTDARCYLDWIATQYGLSMPVGYSKPASCATSTGVKTAVNNTNCLSRTVRFNETSDFQEKCDFSLEPKKCVLAAYDYNAKPAYNLNFYFCLNVNRRLAVCANDCPGVDPNAVVVGGEAALFALAAATAATGPNLIGPLLGAGAGLTGLGLGGVAMMSRTGSGQCPSGQCRSESRRCCPLVPVGRRVLCPLSC